MHLRSRRCRRQLVHFHARLYLKQNWQFLLHSVLHWSEEHRQPRRNRVGYFQGNTLRPEFRHLSFLFLLRRLPQPGSEPARRNQFFVMAVKTLFRPSESIKISSNTEIFDSFHWSSRLIISSIHCYPNLTFTALIIPWSTGWSVELVFGKRKPNFIMSRFCTEGRTRQLSTINRIRSFSFAGISSRSFDQSEKTSPVVRAFFFFITSVVNS